MGKNYNSSRLVNGLSVDASGNVGVNGTPSGSYKFEVTGTAKVSGASTFTGTLNVQGGDAVINLTETAPTTKSWLMTVGYNANAAFEIIDAGTGSGNTSRLKIDGSTGTATFSGTVIASTVRSNYFDIPSGSGYNAFQMGADTFSGGWYIYDSTNGSYRFKINNSGAATFSSTLSATKIGINGTPNTNGATLFVAGSATSFFDAAGTRGISIYPSQGGTVHQITSDYIGTSYYPIAITARGNNADLYLTTSGNILIGSTSVLANEKFGVQNSNTSSITTVPAVARFMNNGSGNVAKILLTDNNIADATISFVPGGGGTSTLSFGIQGTTVNFQSLNLKENGNVGIGTPSPQAPLHVVGSSIGNTLRLTSKDNAGDNWIGFYQSSGTRQGYIGYGYSASDIMEMFQEANEPIIFSTNAIERMRILSNGIIEFKSYGPNTNLRFTIEGGDTFNTKNSSSGTPMYLNYSGNGAIYAGSGAASTLYAGSDERIKENINVVQSTLDKVLQLIPKTFNYKEAKNNNLYYGFIAQDVENVFPELVKTAVEDSMCNDEVITNQKSIESFGLVWASILTKAIQELKAENDDLRSILNRNNLQ